jgi:hypothetical protein
MQLRGLTVAVASAAASLACAIVPNNPSANIAVCKVGNWDGTTFTLNGSCTVVSPTWVLMAWHVGGNTVEQNGERYNVVQSVPHPSADLKLYRVDRPLQLAAPIKLDLLPSVPTSQQALPGFIATILGYGVSGTATATGYTTNLPSGIRREARNAIDYFLPNTPVDFGGGNIKSSDYLVYDLDDPAGVSGPNIMGGTAVGPDEGGLASLDSGGPFMVLDAGRLRVVAVNSIIGTFNGTGVARPHDWGGFGAGVNLQSYAGWVLSTITDLNRTLWQTISADIGGGLTGNSANIAEQDGSYLTSSNSTAGNFSGAQLSMVLGGNTTKSPAQTLTVTLRGRTNVKGAAVEVRLRRWSTGQFESVSKVLFTNTDQTRTLSIPNAGAYVNTDGSINLNLRVAPSSNDVKIFRTWWDVIRIDAQ